MSRLLTGLRQSVARPEYLAVAVIDICCLAVFGVLLWQNRLSLAAAALFLPFQLLLWAVLARNDVPLLTFFALLFPLGITEMIPHPYNRFVLYPGTLLLLAAFRFSRHIDDTTAGGPENPRELRTPVLILTGWLIASFVLALSRGLGSKHFVNYNIFALEVITLSCFFATVPKTLRDVRVLASAIAAAALCIAIVIPLLPSPVGESGVLVGKTMSAPFGDFDLNSVGAIVGTSAVVLLGMSFDTKRTGLRLVQLLGVLALFAALLFTKSRGAWLGFGLASLYVMLRVRSKWLLMVVAGGALVLISSDALRQTVAARLSDTSTNDPSLLGRLLFWKFAVRIAGSNWLFGVGWENFRMVKFRYGFPEIGNPVLPFNTHNMYLEILVDLGIVGIVCFLWLLLATAVKMDRLTRHVDTGGRGLAIGLNAGIIAFALHNTMDCLSGAFMIFGAWLGLAACTIRLSAGVGTRTSAAQCPEISLGRPSPPPAIAPARPHDSK
jgi:O-antigen ligase